MDLNACAAVVGFLTTVAVASLTVYHHKRFEARDLASYVGAFLSGNNLPVALYLCSYIFNPDPPSVATKLHGYEKYVALAGLSFFFLSAFSIWNLIRNAVSTGPDSQP